MVHEQPVPTPPLTPQAGGLRIHLLGPLRIELNGASIHLPRRKVAALLAYLILHPERHSRDHLATLFGEIHLTAKRAIHYAPRWPRCAKSLRRIFCWPTAILCR
ncbi:MAG: hypothetical protein R3A44_21960 [Caldilineaceae bacterium]